MYFIRNKMELRAADNSFDKFGKLRAIADAVGLVSNLEDKFEF